MVRPAPIPSDPARSCSAPCRLPSPPRQCHHNPQQRLRRRDQTTAPLVEKRRYRGKSLPDGFNIDHNHNIWYDHRVVNPYLTLSKVDSIISGQVLSRLRLNEISFSSSLIREMPPIRFINRL